MTCGCSFMNYAAWSNKQATGSLQEKAIIFPQPCKFPINRIIIGVNWDDTQLIAIVCFLVLMWPWSFYLLQHTHRVGIWLQSVPPGSPAGDSGLSQRAVTGQQEHLCGWVGSEGQPRVGNSGALWVGVCVCGITVAWRSSQGQSSQPLCETEFSPNILYVCVCVCEGETTHRSVFVFASVCDLPLTCSSCSEAALHLYADRVKMMERSAPPPLHRRARQSRALFLHVIT